MKRFAVACFVTALMMSTSLWAQAPYLECADVNGNGTVTSADIIFELVEHIGLSTVPAGKGDIDNRQGYTAADTRFLYGYVFQGWPSVGCPPFPAYTLSFTDDTLYLPAVSLPPGDGEMALPIILVTHHSVTDLVVPVEVVGLEGYLQIDSMVLGEFYNGDMIAKDSIFDRTVVFAAFDQLNWERGPRIKPGVHLLATLFVHFTASPGGDIVTVPTRPREHTFLNYVYTDDPYPSWGNDRIDVGMPNAVSVETNNLFPVISVDADTLYFQTTVGYPNPPAQSFTIASQGAPFEWTITAPSWLILDKTAGTSGETISVTPNIAGLLPGDHASNITINAPALGSPRNVLVWLALRPEFPAMDANCDGSFNLMDIMFQINYMFRSGPAPCDPCGGTASPR